MTMAFDKILALRKAMLEINVDAYIVPSEDSHQSEYIANCDKRREWLTGFTGSAGVAVVTASDAALWTDGRYFLQAEKQLDPKRWTLMRAGLSTTPTRDGWLREKLERSQVVAVDASLITHSAADRLQTQLAKDGIELRCLSGGNLIDVIWGGLQPHRPTNPIFDLSLEHSGTGTLQKISTLRSEMQKANCDSYVITELDEVAWLLNARGNDISYNPVFFSYAVITKESSFVFCDAKLPEAAAMHAQQLAYGGFFPFLEQMTAANPKQRSMVSSQGCSVAVLQALGGKDRVHLETPSPLSLLKATKCQAEIAGFQSCHLRDAVALVRYFAWLQSEVSLGSMEWNELTAAKRLDSLRSEQALFRGLSFGTISGYGSNGAIIHYDPATNDSPATISTDSLYLCDSGGQYLDGTTDVTRTLFFGQQSTAWQRECYTRVLMGHIDLALVKFPLGTTGHRLDTIARAHLWRAGLDFMHGTGHGVGHFLNVHEGPHHISCRSVPDEATLAPGMTVTNEPGYYEAGAFGIRLENVMLVCPSQENSGFCEFETLTCVPYEPKLIDCSMLQSTHIDWLNAYHDRCRRELIPLLQNDPIATSWLLDRTEKI